MESGHPRFIQRRSRCSCGCFVTCFCIGCLLSLVVALSVALGLLSFLYVFDKDNICVTKECIRTANDILWSMNESADPCDDFYDFACGNWPRQHSIPANTFSTSTIDILYTEDIEKLRDLLLQDAQNESVPIQQARSLFRSCMNVKRIEELNLEPLKRVLEKVRLPLSPTSPKPPDASLSLWVARLKRFLFRDLLFAVYVGSDLNNASKPILTVGRPEQLSPLPISNLRRMKKMAVSEDTVEETAHNKQYDFYVSYVMALLHMKATGLQGVDVSTTTMIVEKAMQMTKFESKMDAALEAAKTEMTPPEIMTVDELQNFTDHQYNSSQLVWRDILEELYRNVDNVSLDLDGNDRIVLFHPAYLQTIVRELSLANEEVIQYYVWWSTVEMLIVHLDKSMREVHNQFLQSLSPKYGPTSRSIFCAESVFKMMGMAVAYLFADPQFHKSTGHEISEMVDLVVESFKDIVEEVEWMDEDTKAEVEKKADVVTRFIGYPPDLFTPGYLEDYYEGLVIDEENYVDSMLMILDLNSLDLLKSLRDSMYEPIWPEPHDENAYYVYSENSLAVLMGIIQYPIYGLGLDALNYGALGSMVGHELTHGFDFEGHRYDQEGNFRRWWTNRTSEEYERRSQCFVDQYDDFREADFKVDGRLTLSENIADNGGLREALRAYRKKRARSGRDERKLPGLELYTSEQLFFVAFAHMWCHSALPLAYHSIFNDEHAPGQFRVVGTLQNTAEFAQVWRCATDSPMVRGKDSCRLW